MSCEGHNLSRPIESDPRWTLFQKVWAFLPKDPRPGQRRFLFVCFFSHNSFPKRTAFDCPFQTAILASKNELAFILAAAPAMLHLPNRNSFFIVFVLARMCDVEKCRFGECSFWFSPLFHRSSNRNTAHALRSYPCESSSTTFRIASRAEDVQTFTRLVVFVLTRISSIRIRVPNGISAECLFGAVFVWIYRD